MTLSENHRWAILEDLFKKHGFVDHQLTTFNEFLIEGLPRITEEAEIAFERDTQTDKDGDKRMQRYRVGFSSVHIGTPTVTEEDRSVSELTPAQARRRNLSYAANVFADVTTTLEEDGYPTEMQTHQRVLIAKIPIMIGSERCNLRKYSKSERVKLGECPYDEGGYFIVKGTERVLVAQVRAAHNRPFVLKQKPGDKFLWVCETRSMSESTGHSVLVQIKLGVDERTLVAYIPYVKEPVAVGIVFKALGYTTEKDMIDLIGMYGESAKKYLKIIVRDSFFIENQEDALTHIGDLQGVKDGKRREYAWQVVETELFPHLGVAGTTKEKAYFFGHMVNKLISTHLGLREEDDRDNYLNKRVEAAGILVHELYRTLMKRYVNALKIQLLKKKQRPDVMPLIARTTIITSGLHQSFATGNWGVQNTYIRPGVSQVLSRLSFGATRSHLRRVVIPVGKEGKNTKIRQIHTSQIFNLCPAETPEGQGVGLVLNLALSARVTSRVSTALVRDIVEKSVNMIPIRDYEDKNEVTKVLVNGTIVGMTPDPDALVDELWMSRRNGLIHPDVSITFDPIEEEINVYSDEGRLTHPVLLCEDGKILATEEDGTDWDELVFNRRIVYVDSAEVQTTTTAMSEKDLKKFRCDYCEIMPAMILGVMGNMIPFPDHSQSPRNCYQSSMGKQAIGIPVMSHKHRVDTILPVMDCPQRPIVTTKPSKMMGFDDMPSGVNAVVAVACYTGFNQEDSVVLNKGAIHRGLFVVTSYRTLTEEERKKGYNFESISLPPMDKRKKNLNYGLLGDDGVVRKGVYAEKGDVVVGKVLIKSSKNGNDEYIDCSVSVKSGEGGYVDRIIETTTPNGYRMVKIVFRNQRIPEVGDKFASRAAQKGTCGMVIPHEDMPFTDQGIVPDIIINPHALPSRMTINQIDECVMGKACAIEGTFGDATPFVTGSVNNAPVLRDRLAKLGFSGTGKEVMYNGMTGEPFDVEIFIGPTYYQRLKHMVSDKIHARATGPVTTFTRQPLEGRSRDGGLRFGEMERDCMIAHGVSRFLKERLFDNSDPYKIYVCSKCNKMATKTECKICETNQVLECNMPYASKLLMQELMAMGIQLSITVKN